MQRFFPLAILVLPVSAKANPSGFEDLAALEARASAVAGYPVQAIDRRIRLARCPANVVVDAAEFGAVAVRCPALGWRMRIALSKSSDSVSASAHRTIIKRGDGVELTVIGDGFELKSQAVALDDASEGQSLRVKSLTSASMNQVIAVGPGKVLIAP
jgi:flagellar basal body P-ring formation protein FlgA